MPSVIISISGSHGTGKSTAVFHEAEEQKILHPTCTVAALPEQASLSPFPINKECTEAGQMWIFTRQLEQELEYLSNYDITVTDRTAVDAIAYSYVAGFHSLAAAMFDLVRHHAAIYKKIIFKKIENNNFCFHDGIRETTDSRYRQDIEDTLLDFYQQLFEDNFNKIVELK